MLELAFIACIVGQPTQCQEYRIATDRIMTPIQCLKEAQPQLAKWRFEHPIWRVKIFKCVRPGRVAFPELGRDA